MQADGIFSGTIPILEKSLNLRLKKHQLISTNITHVDTPDFKAFDMIVEEAMKKTGNGDNRIKTYATDPDHIPLSPFQSNPDINRIEKMKPGSERNDGNTVDIDKEMSGLAENSLMYDAQAQIIKNKFTGLKNAIKGGK